MKELQAVRNIWACVNANVNPGESIVILTSSDLDPDIYSTVAAAVEAKGADPVVVIIKPPRGTGELSATEEVKFPKSVIGVCKSADAVCQLTTFGLGFAAPFVEARKAGVRWFGFATYYPGLSMITYNTIEDEEKARTEAKIYANLLTKAKSFKLISHGEQLTGKLGRVSYPLSYVAEPPNYNGYWGTGGEAMCAPLEGSEEGSIGIDAMSGLGIFKNPIKFVVQKGQLVLVEDGEASEKVEQFLKDQGDKNSKQFCELAVGTNPAARLHKAMGIHEIKEGIGRVHVGFGDSHNFAGGHPDMAGTIVSKLHWDAVILEPTLELDGKTVVEKGKLLY